MNTKKLAFLISIEGLTTDEITKQAIKSFENFKKANEKASTEKIK